MKSPNEFWLCLHALSQAYEAEGTTPAERADSIVAQFRRMPPIARREVLDEFWPLALQLPDIFQRVAAGHGPAEAIGTPPRTTAGAS